MNRKLKAFAFAALVMAGGLMLTACNSNPAGPTVEPPCPTCPGTPVPYPIRVVSSDGSLIVNVTRTQPAIGARLVAYTGPPPSRDFFPPIDAEGSVAIYGHMEYDRSRGSEIAWSYPLPLYDSIRRSGIVGGTYPLDFGEGCLSPKPGPISELVFWGQFCSGISCLEWDPERLGFSIRIPVNWTGP